MNYFRHSIVARIFCLLMAMHMLNICVDMPDPKPDSEPEDLTVNDMESVVELVLEQGLDIENAIAEHDEADDTDAMNFEMCKDFKFYQNPLNINFDRAIILIAINQTPYINNSLISFIKEINPPPPKV